MGGKKHAHLIRLVGGGGGPVASLPGSATVIFISIYVAFIQFHTQLLYNTNTKSLIRAMVQDFAFGERSMLCSTQLLYLVE